MDFKILCRFVLFSRIYCLDESFLCNHFNFLSISDDLTETGKGGHKGRVVELNLREGFHKVINPINMVIVVMGDE